MRRKLNPVTPVLLAAGIGFAGVYVAQDPAGAIGTVISTFGLPAPGCDIKGNVSINSGERIYHVPGQRYYSETRIRPEYGERWFCSEAEARAAGWRRSGV